VSVTSAFELPAQPTNGTVGLQPLGGNGFTAPHSVYSVFEQVTHDASAGNASISCRFDPRYTQLVSYIGVGQTSGAATVDYFLEIECSDVDRIAVVKEAPLISVVGLGITNQALWTPPAILCSAGLGAVTDTPFFRVVTTNTDTESTILRARVYNFDKRARELVPLPELLGALVRGTNTD